MKRFVNNIAGISACLIALGGFTGASAHASAQAPFQKGETLNYTIEKFKVKVGEASLVYGGIVEVRGQMAHKITVTATGFQFYDEDIIYLDMATFKPIRVDRDLDILGNKEKITELYEAQSGLVRIIKEVDGKKTEEIMEGGKPFDHIHGFIYGQRLRGPLKEGDEIHLHLPTRDVKFAESMHKPIKIDGKKYNSLHMRSTPREFEVYFDRDNSLIPLKIKGAIGVGNMTMVYREPSE